MTLILGTITFLKHDLVIQQGTKTYKI